jgi:hypothetical protein
LASEKVGLTAGYFLQGRVLPEPNKRLKELWLVNLKAVPYVHLSWNSQLYSEWSPLINPDINTPFNGTVSILHIIC